MHTSRAVLIATLGVTVAACDAGMLMPSAPPGRGGTGGSAGRGVPPATGIALATYADGRLEPNAAGAVGAWWSAGDAFAPDASTGPGSCQAAGFPMTACSTLATPTPETPFLPDPAGRMCTSGTAAQVLPGSDGQLAWSAIWGNIVGVSLAGSDPNAMPALGAYDAPAHGITGFAFDIEGALPIGHLRVLVPTIDDDHDSAYWEGAVNDMSP